jgi:hypothetical protein
MTKPEDTGFSFHHCSGSPRPTPATAIANSLYECSNMHKLIHFYYACLNFPVKSTLILAIKAGYLKGFPGLTVDQVRRHINVNVASERGHMDQVRQGQHSTKRASSSIPVVLPHNRVDSNMDTPPQQPSNKRTQHIFLTVHDFSGGIASDQTGRFSVTSNRGNAYLALFYIFNPNYIKSVPIHNRSKEELLRAYTEVYTWLTAQGYRLLLHKLDNKTSRDVEAFVVAEQVKIQYTPPDMHRTNPAERAVRTWKNHFTAGIAGIPPSFPIANWCRLTAQTGMMLNMMRPCRLNPLLLAHEAIDGSFSFNATPLAPLGTEVLIHLKPSRRLTWGYHAAKAWYLSRAMNHYRCIRVIMKDTGAERVTDTFRFQHHAIPVPHITATD